MVHYLIKPSSALRGTIAIPGDKSISHRALMLAAVAEGTSYIRGLLKGQDNLATLNALQMLGVSFREIDSETLQIHGVGLQGFSQPSQPLNLQNSGTGMRLLAGLLAGQSCNAELIGDASLMKRPMQRIVTPLQKMGAQITMSHHGTPPLAIRGNPSLQGITYELPIASAQIKSCLLLAGLLAHGETHIMEPVPTRDHTERMLQQFHYPLARHQHEIKLIGRQPLRAAELIIPGDFSSAAFFIVAATITPNSAIILKDVGVNPTRIGMITILQKMGANITLSNHRQWGYEPVADIHVASASLHGIEIPQQLVAFAIDEFPAIFIAAACAQGKTILKNAQELRVKESDRIAVMAQNLAALGIAVEVWSDGLQIEGGKIQGGRVESFGDHRVAMAFASAGIIASDSIFIQNCDNVMTSFPGFISCAQKLGMQIKEMQNDETTITSGHYH